MPRTACNAVAIEILWIDETPRVQRNATRATLPRVYGDRSSACPRNDTPTSGALPSASSKGAVPDTVCVIPAPPVICRITRPLASFTSAHDVPLNVRTSVASVVVACVALDDAGVVD